MITWVRSSLSSEMEVSPRKHRKIVILSKHTPLTYRKISKIVGVSIPTVSRIIKQNKETGSISSKRRGKCGRNMKITSRDDSFLITQSKNNFRKSNGALNRNSKEYGINISSSTVRKRVLAADRSAYHPIKKQLQTQPMKKKRYLWTLKYKNWMVENWKKVLFRDESHFFFQG